MAPKERDWYGLYGEGWGQEIVPEAFSHPAKFARALIRRIYAHALERGYLREGDKVVDCFAGIGCGAIDATRMGLQWIGSELESDFTIMARRNFYQLARKEWCTCGQEGRTYMRAMREAFQERIGRSQSETETEDRTILQQGVPQQISLFRETIERRTQSEVQRQGSLEQRQAMASRNQTEDFKSDQQGSEGAREESKLERRQACEQTRLCNHKGEREADTGTQTRNSTISRSPTCQGRSNSSQEWESSRQQNGESTSDDDFRTHAIASPEWHRSKIEKEDLYHLRYEIQGETQCPYVRRAMQASEKSRILAQIRREKEGKYCGDCGKLIVAFPVILQGDSRDLARVLAGARAEGIIASPPYSNQTIGSKTYIERMERLCQQPIESLAPRWQREVRKYLRVRQATSHCQITDEGYGTDPANLGNMPAGDVDAVIASPGYARGCAHTGGADPKPEYIEGGPLRFVNYGDTDGQLAALPEGEPPQAIISSPPYARSMDDKSKGSGIDDSKMKHERGKRKYQRHGNLSDEAAYGNTDGQIGAMKEGEPPQGIVSSPPWEKSEASMSSEFITWKNEQIRQGKMGGDTCRGTPTIQGTYVNPCNLGNDEGDTFWGAARAILLQCHHVLAPGGCAIWVVKDFVRNKKRVDFTGQWRSLCESCGFETVEVIRAWLIEDRGAQFALDGELVEKQVARKSFFRRLHESKYPHLSIDYEVVLVTRKAV